MIGWLKLGAGAIVGLAIGYQIGHWRGVDAGYDKHIAETAIATAKTDAERRGDDAKLQSMSDYDLCVAGLRANQVSTEACEALQ